MPKRFAADCISWPRLCAPHRLTPWRTAGPCRAGGNTSTSSWPSTRAGRRRERGRKTGTERREGRKVPASRTAPVPAGLTATTDGPCPRSSCGWPAHTYPGESADRPRMHGGWNSLLISECVCVYIQTFTWDWQDVCIKPAAISFLLFVCSLIIGNFCPQEHQ